MTTETAAPADKSCSDCDLGEIESLACSAERFQKQADIAKESLAQMQDFKTKFATARSDYQKVRDAVMPDVDWSRSQLDELLETLRCKLSDEKEQCLEDALEKVAEAVKKCSTTGCCAGPCEFSSEVGEGESVAQLTGRIDQYKRDVAVSTECFDTLITEQTALKERVARIRKTVTELAAELCAEGSHDHARLYARALVAQWELRTAQLWRGFPTVNDYVDCLCRSLTCTLSGWEAIAVLEGIRVERDCKARAAATACQRKRDQMDDEVYCEYVRTCGDQEDDGCPEPEQASKHSHAAG